MQPTPMSGQTGAPQGPIWSIADAIMSSTYGDEIDLEIVEDDDDPLDDPKIADWSVWNTPRYDIDRHYQVESQNLPSRGPEVQRRRYLDRMDEHSERLLRMYIRRCITEINAVSAGGAGGVSAGNIRGVVTPLGTGPKHPKPEDRKGSKQRNKKRLKRAADAFGGGEFELD